MAHLGAVAGTVGGPEVGTVDVDMGALLEDFGVLQEDMGVLHRDGEEEGTMGGGMEEEVGAEMGVHGVVVGTTTGRQGGSGMGRHEDGGKVSNSFECETFVRSLHICAIDARVE